MTPSTEGLPQPPIFGMDSGSSVDSPNLTGGSSSHSIVATTSDGLSASSSRTDSSSSNWKTTARKVSK